MIKKVIMNLESSKTSGADCIPVAVLKNCEPELSFILAELFNICLKETLQYMSKRVLFCRLLEGLIGGPCI